MPVGSESRLARHFALEARGTSVATELRAGLATYIESAAGVAEGGHAPGS